MSIRVRVALDGGDVTIEGPKDFVTEERLAELLALSRASMGRARTDSAVAQLGRDIGALHSKIVHLEARISDLLAVVRKIDRNTPEPK